MKSISCNTFFERGKWMHSKQKCKGIYIVIFMAILGVVVFLNPISGLAESELRFHVQPQFPESQIAGNTSYFNLNLAEGTTEMLKVTVSNASAEEVELQITAHTAFTNVNGVVEYGKNPEQSDPSLSYELGELIETPDSFSLKAGETKEVEVILNMPAEKFEGLLAGGLRIEEVPTEVEAEPKGTELSIKNTFSYIIGVVVSNDRSGVVPELDLVEVFADQLNYRNVFSATIQNLTPTFVNQLEVEAAIRAEGKEEILYQSETTKMQMAPNSHFNYPISLNGDSFQNGDYVATMTARSGEHEWTWEQKFTINQETARRLNREDVTIDTSINWWMIVAGGLFVLLLLVTVYFLYKKKKSSQPLKEKESTDNELG